MQKMSLIGPPDPADLHSADKQHIRLSYVVQFYFNKGSNATLIDLLRSYEKYSPDLLDRIQFVVVDDASPLRFEIPDFNLNITWLRIIDDIPWNLGGARNLGAVYAKSDKMLMTDLRCEFPEHTLERVVRMRNTGRRIYRFYRKSEKTGAMLPLTHANSFLMSRGLFFRLYGYDEEFCGNYGYFGGWLTQFHRYHGSWVVKMPRRFHYIRHDVTARGGDHDLRRDKSANRLLYERKRNEVRYWGAEAGHSRLFLNFRWKVVKEQFRDHRFPRKIDTAWKAFSWLRTLVGSYR
jgi:hypothetical protein